MSYRHSRPFTVEDIELFCKCRYWYYLDQVHPSHGKRVPARYLMEETLKTAVLRLHRGNFKHRNMETLLDKIYKFKCRQEERKIYYQSSIQREYDWFIREGSKILRNYSSSDQNRSCVMKSMAEPWKTEIAGFIFEGVFDQARIQNGQVYLLSIILSDKLPTSTGLRLNFRNAIQAVAFRDKYGVFPEYIGVYNLYEHREYSRSQPVDPIENRDASKQYIGWYFENKPLSLDDIREITGNNKLRSDGKVYFPEGHQIGPGLNAVRIPDGGYEWLLRSVRRICEEMMAGDRFYINPRQCWRCPHRNRCRDKVEMYEKVEMPVIIEEE